MAAKRDRMDETEKLKKEIEELIQNGIVSKEVKNFEKILNKSTAEVMLEQFSKDRGGLTQGSLLALRIQLCGGGDSTAKKSAEQDYIDQGDVEMKDASMSVLDLHELEKNLGELESINQVLRQQIECFQHWLKHPLRETFLDPDDVEVMFKKNLGKGKCGEVYKAKFKGYPCAVKRFQSTAMKYLLHELKMAAQCGDLNLLNVFGGTVKGQLPLLVCELLHGSLTVFIEKYREAPGLPKELILSLTRDIAKGLSCLHEHNLVHQDLKSENILMRRRGDGSWEAVVSDYGTVDFCTGVKLRNVGSPKYRAPDEWQTVLMDIYSLGLVIQEMYIGEAPDQKKAVDQLNKVDNDVIKKLIVDCTTKDLNQRFSAKCVASHCEEQFNKIFDNAVPNLLL